MRESGSLGSTEILKLIEYIPISGNLPTNGRFAENITIDSQFYFDSLQLEGYYKAHK